MKKNWQNEDPADHEIVPRADIERIRPATAEDLLEAARINGGSIKLIRFDRDSGKMVTDIITDQMPLDEICL